MRKLLLYTLTLVGVLLFTGCGQSGGGAGESAGSAAEAVVQGADQATNSTGQPPATDITAETAAEEAAPSGPTVLFLGDSITAGLGLEPEQAFPAILDARLDSMGVDAILVNAGLSGETSAGGLRRVDWLLQRPVDVLVLELGGNDGLRGVDLQSTRSNLQGIVDQVRAKNPKTVLVVAGMMIPPNLGPDYTKSFAAMYPELAASNDAILIPFLLDGIGGMESLMQRDQIHPNAAGHRAVADLVEPYLIQALRAVPAS
ncbi:MAG: acyl-CoA thioesterase-1 [Rhodothermales bacterium]|jgi:acyl-CoA thioesterase-1